MTTLEKLLNEYIYIYIYIYIYEHGLVKLLGKRKRLNFTIKWYLHHF